MLERARSTSVAFNLMGRKVNFRVLLPGLRGAGLRDAPCRSPPASAPRTTASASPRPSTTAWRRWEAAWCRRCTAPPPSSQPPASRGRRRWRPCLKRSESRRVLPAGAFCPASPAGLLLVLPAHCTAAALLLCSYKGSLEGALLYLGACRTFLPPRA